MRFYFDFLSHDHDEILDCEGVELANWLAAHRHAVRIVKQTVPYIPEGPDWRGWRIQVTDESRRHVLTVLFHAPSRLAASGLTQTCLQTNVPDLTAIYSAQARQDGTAWVSLGGVLSPVATANR
jgi:hypothetical protein